jgi:hypothetical protein
VPIEHLLDDRVLAVHAMILGADSPAPITRILNDRVGRPPFLPLAGHRNIFPHRLARRGDIKIPGQVGVGPRHLDARVAHAPAELEIGRLDGILQERAVDLLVYRVDESGIAFELGKSEGRPEALDHRAHEIGDDVLRMVEFGRGEEARIAGNIGDDEAGQLRRRKQ